MHQAVGFNYRMTNPTAALGCGQVERMDEIVAAKRRIAAFYDQAFAGCSDLQLPLERPWAGNVYWMYHVLLQGRFAGRRVEVMASLSKRGIESRECFVPFNQQELFLQQGLTRADACPVANDVAPRGLYLPSGIDLTDEDLSYVAQQLRELLAAA